MNQMTYTEADIRYMDTARKYFNKVQRSLLSTQPVSDTTCASHLRSKPTQHVSQAQTLSGLRKLSKVSLVVTQSQVPFFRDASALLTSACDNTVPCQVQSAQDAMRANSRASSRWTSGVRCCSDTLGLNHICASAGMSRW